MDIETEIQTEKSDLPIIKQKLKIYQITVIFSLFFALIGFSYNVWRMEVSEENRNIRAACFEMMLELSKFEELIYTAHYDGNYTDGSPRKAWVEVVLVNDLGALTTESINNQSAELLEVWSRNEKGLQSQDDAPTTQIVSAIDAVRAEIKLVLKTLD